MPEEGERTRVDRLLLEAGSEIEAIKTTIGELSFRTPRDQIEGLIVRLGRVLEKIQQAGLDHRAYYQTAQNMGKQNEDLAGKIKALKTELEGFKLVIEYNERLLQALHQAGEQIQALKEELDKLSAPPRSFGVVHKVNEDGTVDIYTGGRKQQVNLHPAIDQKSLKRGMEVILNDAFNIIMLGNTESQGEVVTLEELMEDGRRAKVNTRMDESRIVELAEPLRALPLKVGDLLLFDARSGYCVERLPKSEAQDLLLEKVPDITFKQIGGLGAQIETLLEAIEYPMIYPEYYKEHHLKPDKGILLYGPPGCGKTLMAKAVANRLAQRLREKVGDKDVSAYFLAIKGPELLNKYVGETERKIREAFTRAKEKASEGNPVIIFFDEFEALFRTRGSGISSDIESTIVPQLLAEMDGVEELNNVIVIGASNRQDLIDPAVLRPGRFDLKIKIDRPDESGAREIFAVYVTPDLPWGKDSTGKPYIGQKEHQVFDRLENDRPYTVDLSTPELMAAHVNNIAVKYLFYGGPPISWTDRRGNKHHYSTECVEIVYANNDKKKLYAKDLLVSGAMIASIVTRVKKLAIKRLIQTGEKGLNMVDFYTAIRDEINANTDLPNTNNPDDWAKILGQTPESGSRIVSVKPILGTKIDKPRKVETVTTGQYL